MLEEKYLSLDPKKLPRHVAIIMDGNGRWAKKHAVKVALGHQKGVETLRDIVRFSSDIGIEALSLFAFSTENWSRSKEEVGALMQLILRFFRSEIDELDENNVAIRIIGDVLALPHPQQETVMAAQKRTEKNTGLVLNIGLNYGSQAEIIEGVKQIAQKVKDGLLEIENIDQQVFADHLYTKGLAPVDLLIRTSGEQRLSNFLLYQCAYAELSFPTVLWPDFSKDDYFSELNNFAGRQRRFGGRPE